MPRMTSIRRAAAAASLLLAAFTQGTGSQTLALAQGASLPVGNCAALATMDLQTLDQAPTSIMSASVVAATSALPEYCRVTGYVWPQVKFEVRLPTTGAWNGRFDMTGCGGFCGSVDADRPGFPFCNYMLQRNYAVAATDTGHSGNGALWAFNNPQAQIDFGYRAVHVTTVASKVITTAYYGKPIAHSYFGGCSTGGRQAVMEALRYPDDFEGIISGSPALDQAGASAIDFTWTAHANRDATGQKILDDKKLPLLHDAVTAACADKDGVIADPRACMFNPATLQCAGPERPDCLTAAQVDTVRKLYGGAKNSAGEQLYPGIPFGSELSWDPFVVGHGQAPSSRESTNDQYLKYMAFEQAPGPTYDPLTFNLDVDIPKLATKAAIYNATSPDLRAFRARGGKLIMYQGWADPQVVPFRTIKYYEDVVNAMGGRSQTEQFFRLFMIPGLYHCMGGPGLDARDNIYAALENWVEGGVAPEQLIASHETNGAVDRTRPVYPYPEVAEYTGTGSMDDAANFIPVEVSH